MISVHKPFKRSIGLGDIHFGVRSNSEEWHNNIVDFFRKFFIPLLKANVREGDIMIQYGDIADSGDYMRTEIHHDMLDIFEEIAKILPIYAILGNHDVHLKHSNHINSVRSLGYIDNIHLVETSLVIKDVSNNSHHLMSWNSGAEREREVIDSIDADYLHCHTYIYGFWYDGKYIPNPPQGEVPKYNSADVFKKYKKVFSGHVHGPQEGDNIIMLGSIMHYKKTDIDSGTRRILLLDGAAEKVAFIPNPISSEYKKITLKKFLDMEIDEANAFVNNSYVTIVCPGSIYRYLRYDDINKHLTGYRKIDYISIKEDIEETELKTGGNLSSVKNVDVYSKIPEYIQTLDKPSEVKSRLSDYLQQKYKDAEMKTKIQEIDIS